jgi:hypothetical protein
MAERALDAELATLLAAARQAIDCGDYGRALRQLEPLAEQHGPRGAIGAGVRLLMATALMGQGESERAADCCRALQGCVDATLRARARDLLTVLEAPALRRPRDWSLTLPDLGGASPIEGLGAALGRRRRPLPPPEPSPPPVGPTRAPLGFAVIVAGLLLLLLLATGLGGCMQVRSELRFEGPGRLQLRHVLGSTSGAPIPWQQRWADGLLQGPAPFRRDHRGARSGAGTGERQSLSTPVLPAAQTLDALAGSLRSAAALADLPLAEPQLLLQERNWLVGVRQQLTLSIDLRPMEALPGLDLSLRLVPVRPSALRHAAPLQPRAVGGESGREPALLWTLQPDQLNQLELCCWRWSPLGLGSVAIGLVLVLALGLQQVRLLLGFGPPQLPA